MSYDDDWAKTLRLVGIQGRRLAIMIDTARPGERDVRLVMEGERLLALAKSLSNLSPWDHPHDRS